MKKLLICALASFALTALPAFAGSEPLQLAEKGECSAESNVTAPEPEKIRLARPVREPRETRFQN